jgi:hypothetical protein
MDDSTSPASPWTASPTAKEKNAAQRAVVALLDELAPERPAARGDRLPVPVQRHRTPNGCVLQASNAAVSLSWFPEAVNDAALGELHIVVWRGVVSRRGAPRRPEGASITAELVLRPLEHPTTESLWRAVDGTTFTTEALAAHCLALLEQQIAATEPAQPT